MGRPSPKTAATHPARLADGLWVLGNSYFNLYLVRGKAAAALVDAGISAMADDVIGQLETLGVTPDYLVVTHPHPDHINGLDALRERFPWRIGHRLDLGVFQLAVRRLALVVERT